MSMIKAVVETISPENAKEYLKANTKNFRKKISRNTVRSYADDMASGRWECNGEPIVFDEDGILKNGQHRLAAVILCGKSVKMLVVRGVSRDTTIYDMGMKRTTQQIVAASGVDCNAVVTAAANIIVNRFQRIRANQMVPDYISKHIDELNRSWRVCSYGNNKLSKNSSCIAATYILLRTNAVPVYEAELFWRLFNDYSYTSADGYDISSPMIARKMFDDREGKFGYQIQKERVEIIVRAMNDFHENRHRENKYKIGEPFLFMELLSKVRMEDGLEG